MKACINTPLSTGLMSLFLSSQRRCQPRGEWYCCSSSIEPVELSTDAYCSIQTADMATCVYCERIRCPKRLALHLQGKKPPIKTQAYPGSEYDTTEDSASNGVTESYYTHAYFLWLVAVWTTIDVVESLLLSRLHATNVTKHARWLRCPHD
jgi:hypothetical protein